VTDVMTLAVTVTGTAAARAGAVLAWIAAGRHTKSQLRLGPGKPSAPGGSDDGSVPR